MSEAGHAGAIKKERSPSFPSIGLDRAVDRARAMYEKYRKEPVRVSVVAGVWNYGPKSSGLLQTVATLKQFGLLEDSGSGEDRKVQLTALALRILIDTRPGMRDAAVREAALRPRLFAEYAPRWAAHHFPDDHCISELHLERGFSAEAAKQFLRAFHDTVAYADLSDEDALSPVLDEAVEPSAIKVAEVTSEQPQNAGAWVPASATAPSPLPSLSADLVEPGAVPFALRLKVEMTVGALRVASVLTSPDEVDKLIQLLQANKLFLQENSGGA